MTSAGAKPAGRPRPGRRPAAAAGVPAPARRPPGAPPSCRDPSAGARCPRPGLPQERAPPDLAGDVPLRLQHRQRVPDRGAGRAHVRRQLALGGQPRARPQAGPRRLGQDQLGQPVPQLGRYRGPVPAAFCIPVALPALLSVTAAVPGRMPRRQARLVNQSYQSRSDRDSRRALISTLTLLTRSYEHDLCSNQSDCIQPIYRQPRSTNH